MKMKIFQVDAFADRIFAGNSAAVCPLGNEWLPEATMQSIAMENNLSETAFYTMKNGIRSIRWFTPTREEELCGHATLASAYVIFEHEEKGTSEVEFSSRSGILRARKEGDLITLDFPSDPVREIAPDPALLACFSEKPEKVFKGRSDLMLLYEKESSIRDLSVDFKRLGTIDTRGVIATAKGESVDFVSRFFCPRDGIDEDPATGSAHTTLTNYWSAVLGKKKLVAKQLSKRGGTFFCTDRGDRVDISGKAFLYLQGTIEV